MTEEKKKRRPCNLTSEVVEITFDKNKHFAKEGEYAFDIVPEYMKKCCSPNAQAVYKWLNAMAFDNEYCTYRSIANYINEHSEIYITNRYGVRKLEKWGKDRVESACKELAYNGYLQLPTEETTQYIGQNENNIPIFNRCWRIFYNRQFATNTQHAEENITQENFRKAYSRHSQQVAEQTLIGFEQPSNISASEHLTLVNIADSKTYTLDNVGEIMADAKLYCNDGWSGYIRSQLQTALPKQEKITFRVLKALCDEFYYTEMWAKEKEQEKQAQAK